MTYGYPPPPRDRRGQGPDDEEPGRPRRPREPEPPANAWDPPADRSAGIGRGADRGAGRRIPQPPPPAKHVPPAPGQQPPGAPYSAPPRSPQPYSAPPRSPQPYSPQPYPAQPYSPPPATYGPGGYQATPPRPTSPPPSLRRPPPNNQAGQPKAYPNFPPPVPTSPTPAGPRVPAQGPPRTEPRTGDVRGERTGDVRTGDVRGGDVRGGDVRGGERTGALRSGGMQAPAAPGKGGPPPGGLKPPGGARNFAPPAAPNRAPAGKPGARSPARPALPLPRARSVSFKDVQGLIKQLPQHRPWMAAIGAIAVAVVLAVCGLGSYLLVKDDSELVSAPPTPQSTVVKRDINSRETDPKAMTTADVFPNVDIVVDPSIPPYKRQGEPQINEDCRAGANGEVGKLLAAVGCNQVIRAVFGTPDGGYLVTAGIFNLPDAATAGKASADIKGLVDNNQGRFTGYSSDVNVNLTMVRAPTTLAWEVRGHFIVYTVICKVDGTEIAADDAGVKVILYDMLQKYLRDHVVLDWSIEKSPPAGGAPSPRA